MMSNNNGTLVKIGLHIVLATVLAFVITQGMTQFGFPSIAGTYTLHGYTFDLAALVGSHLVVAKIFFGGGE